MFTSSRSLLQGYDMRMKTAPRHMNVRNNLDVACASSGTENFEANGTSKDETASIESDSAEVTNTSGSNMQLYQHIRHYAVSAAPSTCCGCADTCTDSNVALTPNSEDDNNNSVEVIDLSTKACRRDAQEHSPISLPPLSPPPPGASGETEDKFKDTFLYKIMTDPTFLENIQRNKQAKKFTCPFCKLDFPTDDELSDHMDIKKDESNQLICCACRKSFAQKRYLRYHQRCHYERAKFTCDICTKKYTRLDNLARHNAFHVNPDKFSCTSCEKTFARKDLLNKHQKQHDNKYCYYCAECNRIFKSPVTMINHKQLYHTDG